MQHWYTISEATYSRFHDWLTPGHVLAQVAKFNGDGTVSIPVSSDTHERLERVRQPAETDDQLLFRVLGGKPS